MRAKGLLSVVVGILALFFGAGVSAETYDAITVTVPVSTENVREYGKATTYVYTVAVEKAAEDCPDPEADVIRIPETHEKDLVFIIDQPGTFVYHVYEEYSEGDNIKHDTSVYVLTIYVEADNEKNILEAAVSVTDLNGEKPETILFRDDIVNDLPPVDPPPEPPYDPYEMDTPETPFIPVKPIFPDNGEKQYDPEDPSSGAPAFGDGILIDVGTFVKKIAPPATDAEAKKMDEFESSFFGSIPVLYLVCAGVLPVLIVVLLRTAKKKRSE
ncbi:MAG: hypothetical protein IJ251_08815 [Oscillospiraceae bacterium]|nr:hypothetical protein [Oscillospiraceae bacterium]